jgi:cell division protein FtsL
MMSKREDNQQVETRRLVMRTRLVILLATILIACAVSAQTGEGTAKPPEALWRFDTHG